MPIKMMSNVNAIPHPHELVIHYQISIHVETWFVPLKDLTTRICFFNAICLCLCHPSQSVSHSFPFFFFFKILCYSSGDIVHLHLDFIYYLFFCVLQKLNSSHTLPLTSFLVILSLLIWKNSVLIYVTRIRV